MVRKQKNRPGSPEGAESLKVNERCGTKLDPKLLPEILFDTLE